MPIYLVQHALSLPKEQDPERGISETGRSDTTRIAGVARGYQVKVGKIQHSGKKRAEETAAIFDTELMPESGTEIAEDLSPMDDIRETANRLNPASNLMIIGHLPHLEKLTSWLVSGQTEHPVFKFQNSGIVCLDRIADVDPWFIKWTLMPKIGEA